MCSKKLDLLSVQCVVKLLNFSAIINHHVPFAPQTPEVRLSQSNFFIRHFDIVD